MSACIQCGKGAPASHNYCDWDCHVAHAVALGGKMHQPNGLPIRCIRHDGNGYECEDGDHPSYIRPVTIEYIGKEPLEGDEWVNGALSRETHALLWTDGNVALTLYESCYAMVHIGRYAAVYGSMYRVPGDWRMAQADVDFCKAHVMGKVD